MSIAQNTINSKVFEGVYFADSGSLRGDDAPAKQSRDPVPPRTYFTWLHFGCLQRLIPPAPSPSPSPLPGEGGGGRGDIEGLKQKSPQPKYSLEYVA